MKNISRTCCPLYLEHPGFYSIPEASTVIRRRELKSVREVRTKQVVYPL